MQLDGKEVVGMAYIMDLEMDHGLPSLAYYQTVQEGYEDCGLDVSVLERAVLDSAKPWASVRAISRACSVRETAAKNLRARKKIWMSRIYPAHLVFPMGYVCE